MAKTVAVVLSGCGVYDGSEIHEAVLTLLALDRRGVTTLACAPDVPQMHVVDHLTGETVAGPPRNVLVESARIARGRVTDLARVRAGEVDGVVLPGGFGAAKNLSDFAVRGAHCAVRPELASLLAEVHRQGKPIAALCIAPALLACVFGGEKPRLTIGSDRGTADALEAMGAVHVPCTATEVMVDRERRLVTTPAYMVGRGIAEVADGIDRAMAALCEML